MTTLDEDARALALIRAQGRAEELFDEIGRRGLVAPGSWESHVSRTGLDHIAWGVGERSDLDSWTGWLDEIGVAHSGVIDKTEPIPYSTVVFRDPDNIQLELIHLAG